MKKYLRLQSGDTTQPGDEWLVGGEWEEIPLPHMNVAAITAPVRRPIPYEGKMAFLVTYSPMIRVVIDTTGLSDEEIDDKLAEAAKAEFCYNHGQHMNDFHDNINWEQTREDTEVPFVDEPKNPGKYRMLVIGDVIQDGDEYKHFLEDEYRPVAGSIGKKINEDVIGSFRRPIAGPRYRPFKLGETIGEGDQVEHKGEWLPFAECVYGDSIDSGFVKEGRARKLIK